MRSVNEIDIARYVYNCEKLKDHYGYSIWSEPEHKTSIFLQLIAQKVESELEQEVFSLLANEVRYYKWVPDESSTTINFSERNGAWTKDELDAIQACMDRYHDNKQGDYAKLVGLILEAIENKFDDKLLCLVVQDQRQTLQQYRDNLLKERHSNYKTLS